MRSLIFDAHLDLSMNALEWNRDLRWSLEDIRASERGMTDKPDRGRGTVSFGEMRRGNVGLCVATLIARFVRPRSPIPGWHSQEQAWAQTQGQLAWYRMMEDAGEMVQIASRAGLEQHLAMWHERAGGHLAERNSGRPCPGGAEQDGLSPEPPLPPVPLAYILSLEGADSLVTLHHLERAYAMGLRAIGPAHYGPGVYAQGTNATGGLGTRGRALLEEMERLDIILDASHLCDESFWEALDVFRGPVWASHSNCRALVPHNRQFADEQIEALIDRGAVIGVALDAWMLVPGWKGPIDGGTSTPESTGVRLAHVVDHIDHICQLAGNSLHAGIGSDLDGAFGTEQCPLDVDTIADLQRIPGMLAERGYSTADVDHICSGNLVRFLAEAWT